jgi:hypothetical protein
MFVLLQMDSNYIHKNLFRTYGEGEVELQAFLILAEDGG